MADPFEGSSRRLDSPACSAVAVVPSDNVGLDTPRALYVGTGGHIAMKGSSDSAQRIWKNVQAGSVLPFRPSFILATGTTAADILALY